MGASLGTGLFLLTLISNASFSVMGVSNDTLTQMVFGENMGLLIATQLRIWAAMAGLGGVAGALCRVAFNPWRRADLFAFLTLIVAHLSFVAGAIIYAPQLYTETLFEKGGVRAALQVALTDHLTPFQARLPAFAVGVFITLSLVLQLRRSRAGRIGLTAVGLAAVAAAALATRGPEPTPQATGGQPRRPNILILGVDSLRADRLTDARVMPNLAALTTEGTRFTRAYTAIPRTFPSWISLLTGRYPARNNLRHMFPRAEQRAVDFEALPARLAPLGYHSAVVSDFAGDIFTRVELGFSQVIAPTFKFPTLIEQRSLEIQTHLLPYLLGRPGRAVFPVMDELAQLADANLVSDRAVRAIDSLRADGDPWLLTVFYGNAHFPYAAQHPYYHKFTRPEYGGRFRYHRPPDAEGTAGVPSGEDTDQIRGLYDGALSEVDAGAARLLAHLEAIGERENTLIVVLSDHGEHLGEPGVGIGHGEHLRGEGALKIPFLFAGPGIPRGETREDVARSVDLVPTLLSLLGETSPAGTFDGVDLKPVLEGQALDDTSASQGAYAETGIWFTERGPDFFQKLRMPYPDLTALCEVDLNHGAEVVLKREWALTINVAKHRALIVWPYKLIYVPLPDRVAFELYDLRDETERDVSPAQPEVLARLRDALYRHAERNEGAIVRAGYILPGPNAPPPEGALLLPKPASEAAPRVGAR